MLQVPDWTQWLAANIVLLFMCFGFGWSVGCWLWATILWIIRRATTPRSQS